MNHTDAHTRRRQSKRESWLFFSAVCASVVAMVGCGSPKQESAKPPIASQTAAPEKPVQQEPEKKKGFDFLGLLLAPVTIPIDLLKGKPKPDQEMQDSAQPVAAGPSLDPPPAIDVVFQVEVYHLTLPYGAVIHNTEFWNRLNEQLIDPATYDVLQRNGIRVGEAPFSDWAFFRDLIEQHNGTIAQVVAIARESKSIEISMRKDVPFEDIFYFNRDNRLIGQSFERCDNLINIAFQPAPRKPGSMRLTLAPCVRSQRKRLEFNLRNEEVGELQYVAPQSFYDCNLKLDVPLDSFIVVAGSPESARQTSIGNRFLAKDAKTEQEEQVLIIVPKPRRLK